MSFAQNSTMRPALCVSLSICFFVLLPSLNLESEDQTDRPIQPLFCWQTELSQTPFCRSVSARPTFYQLLISYTELLSIRILTLMSGPSSGKEAGTNTDSSLERNGAGNFHKNVSPAAQRQVSNRAHILPCRKPFLPPPPSPSRILRGLFTLSWAVSSRFIHRKLNPASEYPRRAQAYLRGNQKTWREIRRLDTWTKDIGARIKDINRRSQGRDSPEVCLPAIILQDRSYSHRWSSE